MMKHLSKLALVGALGVFLLAGDAEACHKKKCGGGCGGAQRVKKCGGGHKRQACATPVAYNSCGGGYGYGGGGGYAYGGGYQTAYGGGYGYGAPMATGQNYAPTATGQYATGTTPQAPGKGMMGTPQR